MVTIGLDNVLSCVWHQAIIWNNFALLLIQLLDTHLNEIIIKI